MSLGKADIEKIARLARLKLDEEHIPEYARHLSNILNFVDQMNAVEAHGIVPMAHPLDLSARLRADEVTEPDGREEFQAIAPQVDRGLYLVPKVIE